MAKLKQIIALFLHDMVTAVRGNLDAQQHRRLLQQADEVLIKWRDLAAARQSPSEFKGDAPWILERAAFEPCHRADYGWAGTCQSDAGPDNLRACASCLARIWRATACERMTAEIVARQSPTEDVANECLMADCRDPQEHFCFKHCMEVYASRQPTEDVAEKARRAVQELWRCGYFNNPSDERAEEAAACIIAEFQVPPIESFTATEGEEVK